MRGGFGARVFCGAEQFCRRSAKLSNIPCQLPAKLEMKFPFPVSARDVDFNWYFIQDVWNWNEYLVLRWDRTSLSPTRSSFYIWGWVELSWRRRKKRREIYPPPAAVLRNEFFIIICCTKWRCLQVGFTRRSVLKERKLPAGKYFIISHSEALISSKRRACAAGCQCAIELRVRRELNLARERCRNATCAQHLSRLLLRALFYIRQK